MLASSRRLPTWTPLCLAALLLASGPAHAATATAGQGHSAVVLPDGTLWVFGANDRGQLGDGTGVPALTPAQVPGLAGVVAVASGDAHLLALTSTGNVWAWGANDSGQVGDGTNNDRLVPVSVLTGAVGIDAGPDFSLAWKADGSLWTWGANASGQLGDGTELPSDTPAAITGVAGVVQASAGQGHAIALGSDGTIWAWGANGFGQLGDGTQVDQLSPVAVTAVPDAAAVVAGAGSSYALRSDGSVWAWGANSFGQLGDGTTTSRLTAAAVGVPAAVQEVLAGAGHVLARLADGTVWSWGRNDFGQVGDGTLVDRLTPAPLVLTDVAEIAAGLAHSLAVTTDGVVWTWGRNTLGQLGDGTTEDRAEPVAISGPGFSWKVGRPVLDPPEGTYEAAQDVTVTTVTAGASILYTTDGSEPDETGPSMASGGTVAVEETTTLKAQAVKEDRTPSDVVTAEYTLQVPAVTFSPEGGPYAGPQTVTLACAEAAEIRYTEDGSEPDESSALYTDPIDVTESTTLEARAYKAGWEPSEAASADYEIPTTVPVEWTDLVGVVPAGSTLVKSAGGASAWDAGAVSTKAIASGDGWVEAVVETTGSTQMFGLAQGNSGQGYGDIDFALFVNGSSLYVYEGGVSRGSLGGVVSGDTLRVAVEGGVVRYLKNDVEQWVSSTAPAYPLLVDTSIKNPDGRVSSVTLSGVLTDVVLEAPGTPVVWTDLVGVVAAGSSLEKTGGTSAWDAGAVSTKAIASGDGWVEAVVEATSSTQMFGLAQGQSGEGYGDIDFALFVNGSSLYAYEDGVSRGSLGPVVQGDRLRVVVQGGTVQYVRNGKVLLVSGTGPTYPLLVDTSIKNPGGCISNVTVSGLLADVVLDAPGVPVVWTDLVGVVATANNLEKTGAASAWDAGAASTKGIASGDGWVEAVVEATSSTQMFGLSDGNSGEGYGDIDFALYVNGSSLYVYEGGVSRGSLGPVVQGDRLRVVAEGGVVRYVRNGKVLLTSGAVPTYPLLVDTSIKNPGGRISNVTISGLLIDVPPVPGGVPVQWMDLVGVEADGNTLEKAPDGASAWDAGAVSTKAIAAGDGWVEAVLETTSSTQMFGLAQGQSGQGYGDIDFALYVNGSSLYVYEGGVSRGSLGPVTQGDRLRVVVAGGLVRYHRNDLELWVSGTPPTYPLLVDTSIKNPGGRISDVTVSGMLTDVVLEAPGTPVEWMDLAGVEADANTLEKAADGVSAWDAGAVSTKAIASGDGWVEAVVETTSSTQMFGLAQGQSGEGYGDIDFVLYVNGSSLYAYEGGVSRGSLGPVTQGDRLRVVVEGGVVKYVRNGKELLASAGAPTYPLLVDTSIKNPGGRVSSVTVSGDLVDVVLDPPGLPVAWTDLVGVVADANTLEKTSAASAWDAGAISTTALASGDGWVEAVVEATSSTQMFGLSLGNSDQGYADIDFALYVTGSSLYAYEGGVSRGNLGPVTQGDRLRVAVEGGVVKYVRNGKELLESGVIPTHPLLVDTSIKNPGGRIARATIQGDDLQTLQVEAPSLTPPGGLYTSPITVTLTPVTPGSTVHYSTDGFDPTEASPLYTAPVDVDTLTDFRARAFKPGWDPSPVAAALYQFNYGTLAPPTLSPVAGTYLTSVEVTLSGPVGASLHYTTDGSDPTTASSLYVGPFTLTTSATVRAASFHPDWTPSPIAEAAYELQVATPGFTPGAGSYSAPQDVAITTPTPGATVRYTTDGSDPTESDPTLGPGETVHVDQSRTLRARAWKAGATPSDVASADYTIATLQGAIAAGRAHSLALTGSGDVWAWGANWYGQLGDSTTDSRNVPVPVPAPQPATSVAGGGYYSLALDSDGTVWAWGANWSGQLGDGTDIDQTAPVQVTGLTGVTAIAAGYEHSLALKSDGTVWAWGSNESGQLGDGTTENRLAPVQVAGLVDVTAIAAGREHSLALGTDGTLWAWGDNDYAQLGDGTTTDRETPAPVQGLSDSTAVAAGYYHSLVLTSDGTVWAWGSNWSGQLGDGSTEWRPMPVQVSAVAQIAAIAAGAEHSLAVGTDGAVWGWGANWSGQLGDGTTQDRFAPVPVPGLTEIVAVAAGSDHSLALTQGGQVFSWGYNGDGQLGIGVFGPEVSSAVAISAPGFGWSTVAPAFVPPGGTFSSDLDVTVTCPDPTAAIHYTTDESEPTQGSPSIPSGSVLTLSQTTTLKAGAWRPDRAPSAITTGTYAFAAATPTAYPPPGTYAGRVHVSLFSVPEDAEIRYTTDGTDPIPASPLYQVMVTLTEDTTLKAKAFPTTGALDPSATATFSYTVTPPVGAVAAGTAFSMAVDPSGAVWAWGANASGQLGDGSTNDSLDPLPVSGPAGVVALASGAAHSLALADDGSVWAWGDNASGQIGSGVVGGTQLTPVPVGIADVVAVAAGGSHSLALARDGNLFAWGSNSSGQLGDGTTDDRATPAVIPVLTNVVAVAAGDNHSLALTADGRVWAWGDNAYGQIGSDSYDPQQLMPVEVMTDAVFIAAGAEHSLAIKSDTSGWAWGRNNEGQLGSEDWGDFPAPVRIVLADPCGGEGGEGDPDCGAMPFTGVTLLAGGGAHTLALRNDALLWSWGDNGVGQLGNGGDYERNPVEPLSGLSDVVWAAGGQNHSLAVTAAGEVWAWGGNASGQVGDGTTQTRWDPVLIVPAGFAWRLPRPLFSPPPGYYTTTVDVSVTTPVAEAVVRYTTDGTEPIETSALVTGPIPITGSTELKARTFKAGWTPSATGGGLYSFYFGVLAPPVATPAGGTYVTSVEVTLTADHGATISFDLCDPGPTNCTVWGEYTGPLQIDRSRILRSRASHADWGTSLLLTQTYTVQPAQPLLDPAGGTYPAGQLITVTCPDPGTTLHYTTSGADPTESDRPLACEGSIPAAHFTLKVRAFKPGLAPSEVATEDYSLTGDLTTAALRGGEFHSLALLPNGHLWAWGQNLSGQVGETGGDAGLGPSRVSALAAVTGMAGGQGHSLAVTADGYVWAWGDNEFGQIGEGGTLPTYNHPVRVHSIGNATAVAAGKDHSLALAADGQVWAWGYNYWGQLGDGTNANKNEPVQVVSLADVVGVAAGANHSLALRSDGTVWSWGFNAYGQLGDGTTTGRSQPVAVTGLSNVTAIAAGANHSLAVTSDGHLWAWGLNTWGQLGAGVIPNQSSPVEVIGLTEVTAASGGTDHSLALTADGRVWSWGSDSTGQLGAGVGSRSEPGLVPGLTSIGALAAGGLHSLAATSDGRVWAWGYNYFRQLGDWATANRSAPGQISEAGFAWMASTPTFSPASGTYNSELSVDAVTATPGADVRYTLDGTDPTETSPIATGAIAVDQSLAFKARAYRIDLAPSSAGSADYVLEVPAPLLSPSGGTHHHFVEVTVTSAVGSVTLHFTLDGSEPTESDPEVASGATVDVRESGRLSVKGWRPGWDPSAVAVADYVITAPRPLDTDGDGLSDADEATLGSDPNDPDTNGDGLPDGAAYAAGLSVTDTDMDGDGLANLNEATAGTDPFDPDSDGDTALDGADCYPLDPARSACLPPNPEDVTPPDIVLAEPTNAVLVGTVP